MLASIHPLGERGRHNRWVATVAFFTAGAIGAGAATLGAVAALGSVLLPAPPRAIFVAAVLVAAGVADLARITVPGPHRQVNERWIGTYRGWVYGAGFGLQLGTGLATYVVTWSTYALVVVAFMSASATAGLIMGAVFGLGRALPVLATAWIDRPSRLAAFHQRVAGWAAAARVSAGTTIVFLGLMGTVVA
jgi:hypothetical protein